MTTKIVVLGMIHYPYDTHYMSLPLVLLGGKGDNELISFEVEMVEMYGKLIAGADDASQKMDEVFHKYLDAIDQADVLLLLNPDSSLSYEADLGKAYTAWLSYSAGYAYAQGVPSVLYAGKEDVSLHPFIHRQAHSVLHNVGELLSYDFGALAPINKSKILLPVKTAGGL